LKTQTASKSPAHHTSKELADLVNTKHVTSSVSFGAKFHHSALENGYESYKTKKSFEKMAQRSPAIYPWKNVLKSPDLDYRF
jgi:hypothetical protein